MRNTILLFLILIFTLSFCKGGKKSENVLNGAGATFPYPVYSAWAQDFEKSSQIKLNYQSIGSGGGIQQISNRTVDFGASDKPLEPSELETKKLLQFPAVIGGVVPVINIPGVESGKLSLDGKTLCKVYLGEIKKWNEKAIKTLNSSINLPNEKITVVTRSDGSGTTALFTRYLSENCPEWKEKVGADTSVKFPVGLGAKGNEGITNYVQRVKGAIGYVEFAYAHQNHLNHISLINPAGNSVEPSFEAFQDAAATGEFKPENHFYLWLINSPGEKSWPISGASYILLAKEKPEINKRVVQFFDWTFKNGDETAKKLVYVPLPDELKNKIREYWKANNLN